MQEDIRSFDDYYNVSDPEMRKIFENNIKDTELVDKIMTLLKKNSFTSDKNRKEIALESIEFILGSLKLNPQKIQTILKEIDPDRDLTTED